jgi:hypothetical protein
MQQKEKTQEKKEKVIYINVPPPTAKCTPIHFHW